MSERQRSRPVPLHGVHLIELTGHGGIFQHTVKVGQILIDGGLAVTLHTSAAHEPVDAGAVTLCTCSPWRRGASRSRKSQLAIAARYAARTVVHLVRASRPGEVAHVQGIPSTALILLTLVVLRCTRRAVVLSPHRTFSRRRSRLESTLIERCARLAAVNIAFSLPDAEVLKRWNTNGYVSPLVQLVPRPDPRRIARWRSAWQAGEADRVVLFAGQIRRDKRLDLLVESAARWPSGMRLAVVGEDRGDWARCRELAARLGVQVHATPDFVELDDFVAAIASADVVVSPYDTANQSGVLVLARDLGVPAVASRVGGLAELATELVDPDDVDALTAGIEAAIRRPRRQGAQLEADRARDVHLDAYDRALGRERP
jgi:glycosyltransferase involved in cell wall biosynthesis